MKPKEYTEEELDSTDPDSYYFVYICKKNPEMVIKKKMKLGRLTAKELREAKGPPVRPVLK